MIAFGKDDSLREWDDWDWSFGADKFSRKGAEALREVGKSREDGGE